MAARQALVSAPRKNTDPRIKEFGALERDVRSLANRLDEMQKVLVGYDLPASIARYCDRQGMKQESVLNLGDTARKLRCYAGFLQVLITIAEHERILREANESPVFCEQPFEGS